MEATVARRTSLPPGTVTVATFRNPVGSQHYDDKAERKNGEHNKYIFLCSLVFSWIGGYDGAV